MNTHKPNFLTVLMELYSGPPKRVFISVSASIAAAYVVLFGLYSLEILDTPPGLGNLPVMIIVMFMIIWLAFKLKRKYKPMPRSKMD